MIVALTGGIGSGKSEASNIFAELGLPIVDLDVISHALTAAKQPLIKEISATFGEKFVNNDGALNRKAMRELVFSDTDAREKLNNLLHPAIHQEALRLLEMNRNAPYQIIAIPLLTESKRYLKEINRVLVIDCDENKQIERVKARSHLSESEALQIIRAQSSREERLNMADDIIENNESLADLRKKILQIHQKYITLA
jgi:dephospho-CoA kinase